MSQTSPRCGEYRRARVKVFSASVLSWSPAFSHIARSIQSWLPYVNALSAHRSPRTTASDAACLILSCSANAIVAVFSSTGSRMWFSRCRSASKIHAACADRKTPNKVSATRSHVLVEVLGFIVTLSGGASFVLFGMLYNCSDRSNSLLLALLL